MYPLKNSDLSLRFNESTSGVFDFDSSQTDGADKAKGRYLFMLPGTHNKKHVVYYYKDCDTLEIIYIGCTSTLYFRISNHKCNKTGYLSNKPWREYFRQSVQNNKPPIIKIHSEHDNWENAHKIEVALIKHLKPKYNILHNN